MTTGPEVTFVNDVERLEWALKELDELHQLHGDCEPDYCDVQGVNFDALGIVLQYVPILIKSYEELFAQSMNLTAAWEAFMNNTTPAGLYLPPTTVESP